MILLLYFMIVMNTVYIGNKECLCTWVPLISYISLLVQDMIIIFCKEIFEMLYDRFQQKNHKMWGVPKTPFLLQAFTYVILYRTTCTCMLKFYRLVKYIILYYT